MMFFEGLFVWWNRDGSAIQFLASRELSVEFTDAALLLLVACFGRLAVHQPTHNLRDY
jgi:hypothetical protein